MNYLLMLASVGATVTNNSLRNKFSKDKLKKFSDFFAFNSVVALATMAVLLILGKGFGHVSAFTIVVGLIFGAVIAGEMIVALIALSIGPMAYTNLIGLCGMVIPTFSGMLFWNETVKPAQYIGIALMLLSFVLGINPKKDKKMSAKWVLLCAILFCLDGSMGVIQKVHQTSPHKEELSECLIIAFGFTFVALVVLSLVSNRAGKPRTIKIKSSLGGYAAVCGICMALIHTINIYLSGRMDSAFFFPAINGACIIGSVLASVFLFKERLSRLQKISITIGIISILLVGNITDLFLR